MSTNPEPESEYKIPPVMEQRDRVFNWHSSHWNDPRYSEGLRKRVYEALQNDNATDAEFGKLLDERDAEDSRREPPPEILMPWDDPDLNWPKPKSQQVARIIAFMWGREQADRQEFIAHVWANDEISDTAVRAATSRANLYLVEVAHMRGLEKPREKDVIRRF
jgi:hypothetical protein